MGIPERLTILKDHFQWNNIRLAKAAGVSKQAVSTWMNYGVIPGQGPLIALRKNYRVNDEWVLGMSEQMLIDDSYVPTKTTGDMRDELRDILLEISLGDPDEADRVIKILRAYLDK